MTLTRLGRGTHELLREHRLRDQVQHFTNTVTDLGATDLSLLRSVQEAHPRRALTQRNAGSVAPECVTELMEQSTNQQCTLHELRSAWLTFMVNPVGS